MESIGARFNQTREARGYTLEQVARDTHIARRFLEALEQEDFAIFPGEPYLLGFMRTYANYLGLDPEETVALYHNLKLQEQPPPIDELINRRPAVPVGRILVIVAAVIVIGAGVYLAVSGGLFDASSRPTRREPVAAAPGGEPEAVFHMADEIVEQRFSEGERIMVPVRDSLFAVDLLRVDDALTVLASGREQRIRVGEEALIDVNDDAQSDLRIVVRSVDTADAPRSVVMRLDRGVAAAAAGRPTVQDPVGEVVDAPSIGSTREPTREESVRLIAAYDEPEEFPVTIEFGGYAMFRYEADGQARVEQYHQPGETIEMVVRDRLKLWLSNAASARLQVAGQEMSLGGPGEVTAGLITWVADPESDRVLLELIPVY